MDKVLRVAQQNDALRAQSALTLQLIFGIQWCRQQATVKNQCYKDQWLRLHTNSSEVKENPHWGGEGELYTHTYTQARRLIQFFKEKINPILPGQPEVRLSRTHRDTQ